MAIIDIQEQSKGRGGVTNAPIAEQGQARQWLVITDSRQDNRSTIRADARWIAEMPAYGTGHPDDPTLRLKSIDLNPATDNASTLWIAVGTYSAMPFDPEEEEKENTPNPLDRFTKFSVGGARKQLYRVKDATGKPYVNSAGEPFPPQPYSQKFVVYELEKNIQGWDVSWVDLDETLNTNSVTFTDGYKSIVVAAKTGLMQNLRVSRLKQEGEYKYYTLTCEIHVLATADKWKQILIDSGFNQRDPLTGDLSRIKVKAESGSGVLVDCVSEQLLNGAGGALYINGVYSPDLDPEELDFKEYSEAVWDLPVFSS